MKPQTPFISQDIYKSFFDNLPDGLAYCRMMVDAGGQPIDFTCIQANKQFERLTGLKKVIGNRITELAGGKHISSPELMDMYGRVSLTGKPEQCELSIGPLKRYFFVSVTSQHKNYFMLILKDITERKHIEKKLENAKIAARNVLEDLQAEKKELAYSKAKDEAMLESIGDGVVTVDSSGKIIFVNQAAQHLLGWTSAEIMGTLLFDVLPVEDEHGQQVPADRRPMEIALTKGMSTTTSAPIGNGHTPVRPTTVPTTYYYVNKQKKKFPVSIAVAPVILDHTIVGAIEVFHDVTKEKEIDKAKTEFVSLASHQVRGPLVIMQWAAEHVLESEQLSRAGKNFLQDIIGASRRLSSLVEVLLNVSRLEAGNLSIAVEKIDACSIVRASMEQMNVVALKKNITLSGKFMPDAVVVTIDSSSFRIIEEVLLSNALDYTLPGGGVFLTIKKGDHAFVLSVRDTGIGIPEADKPRIFQKFNRAANAKKLLVGGAGLGLYLASQLVKLLEGRIWFESQEGKGSTFFVELPLALNGKNTS